MERVSGNFTAKDDPPHDLSHGGLRLSPLQLIATAGLVMAAIVLLVNVYQFALTRFFTIDEYQWGHATWLIREGKVPYRDFYEHHLPLGYIAHSWLLSDNASFVDNALRLRVIAFSYVVAACVSVGAAEYVTSRNPCSAPLYAAVPISVGFGLMSAIDYRGDNWSAFTLICCFSIIQINQVVKRKRLAAVAGALFSLAILMTQKTLLVGGLAIFGMLLVSVRSSFSATPPTWIVRASAQRIDHPGVFCIAAAIPVAVMCGVGAAMGVLEKAFEITVIQAWEHERLYPRFSAWKYIYPYLYHAPVSTTALAIAAIGCMIRGARFFWTLPTLGALIGCSLIKAPYAYNFVLPSFLLGICATRGFWCLGKWLARQLPQLGPISGIFQFASLPLIPLQFAYVSEGTTNAHQLETLRQIEKYTSKTDVVIDSEGSALFRPDRGYYWYQGRAHVQMFRDYYEGQFLQDLRATQAPFWINGMRSKQFPKAALAYLTSHYIPMRGDLFVLGFRWPNSPLDQAMQHPFEVVREAVYYLDCEHPALDGAEAHPSIASSVLIDGQPAAGCCVRLAEGWHRAQLPAGSRGCQLSYLPLSAFNLSVDVDRHAPLFEYDRPR
jgi:hypothetical protein